MRKVIQYAIDDDTGWVVSRVGDELAYQEIYYEGMTPENGYRTTHSLAKCHVYDWGPLVGLKWTRKIPVKVRNEHRKFWGFKLLKE